MSNTVGNLNVELGLGYAQFQSDMGKATQIARVESAKLATAMREQTQEAKGSLMLLGDTIGVHLPREMRTLISHSTLIGPALAAAFKLTAITAGIAIIAEYQEKIAELAQTVGGFTKEMKDAEKATEDYNRKLLTQFDTIAKGRQFISDTNKELRINAAIQDYLRSRNTGKELASAVFSGNITGMGEIIASGMQINGITGEGVKLNARLNEQLEQQTKLTKEKQKADEEAAKKFIADLQAKETKLKELSDQAYTGASEGLLKVEHEYEVFAAKVAAVFANDIKQQRLHQEQISEVMLNATKERNRKLIEEQEKLTKELQGKIPVSDKFPFDLSKMSPPPNVVNGKSTPYEVELEKLRTSGIERAKEASQVFMETRTEAQKYRFEIEKLNILLAKGDITQGEYNKRVGELKLTLTPLGHILSAAADGFGRMFEGVILGTESLSQAFKNLAQTVIAAIAQMIAKMLAMWAIQKLTGLIFPGSKIDFSTGTIKLGGKRAEGGPVSPGSAFLVGERGPELFMPDTAGRIIPNGGGGGNIYIDARGASPGMEHRIYAVVKQALKMNQAATIGRLQDQYSRT